MRRATILILAVMAVMPLMSRGAEPGSAGTVQEEKVFEREITVTARLKYLRALPEGLSRIHISEPTRLRWFSDAVLCFKNKTPLLSAEWLTY